MSSRRCPFCRRSSIEVRQFFTEGPDYYAFCLDCGASGPVAESADEALAGWDRSHGFVMLPVEPDRNMLNAGYEAIEGEISGDWTGRVEIQTDAAKRIWWRMVEAFQMRVGRGRPIERDDHG